MKIYDARVVSGHIRVDPVAVTIPEPGRQQLLVRVQAAGLNKGELIKLHHQAPDVDAPVRLGMEAAGEVVRVGTDTPSFQSGDRVMGRCSAAFSEFALMDACNAMHIPERLSWIQAAAIPITYMVVYDMLMAQGHLAAGEWLLVTGISSGVGTAALQVAQTIGAHVIGTSRTTQKLADLRARGLDVGLHTSDTDFHEAVMAATGGGGANLAVNIVGGSMFAECVRSLAFEGRLAIVGNMDGVSDAALDLATVHAKRLTLFGVSSKNLDTAQRQAIVQGVTERILPLFADGSLTPVIDRVFPFDDLERAIGHMESGAQLGKIVLAGRSA